jgi:hypothetical protein
MEVRPTPHDIEAGVQDLARCAKVVPSARDRQLIPALRQLSAAPRGGAFAVAVPRGSSLQEVLQRSGHQLHPKPPRERQCCLDVPVPHNTPTARRKRARARTQPHTLQ